MKRLQQTAVNHNRFAVIPSHVTMSMFEVAPHVSSGTKITNYTKFKKRFNYIIN